MNLETKSVIRFISFDPSAGFTGWAILDHHKKEKKTYVFAHGLLKGDRELRKRKKIMIEKYGKQYSKQCALGEAFAELLTEYNPDIVVSEGPFAHKFINAYASLKMLILVIKQKAHAVLDKPLYEVQPTEAKLIISGKGTATKDDVKSSILNVRKDIIFKKGDRVNKANASEHEFDAIAVGYCFIKKYLPGLLMVDVDVIKSKTKKK